MFTRPNANPAALARYRGGRHIQISAVWMFCLCFARLLPRTVQHSESPLEWRHQIDTTTSCVLSVLNKEDLILANICKDMVQKHIKILTWSFLPRISGLVVREIMLVKHWVGSWTSVWLTKRCFTMQLVKMTWNASEFDPNYCEGTTTNASDQVIILVV